jgi:hypothetical protein
MVLGAAAGLPLSAVREQIASAVDLVVQIARSPGGERRVIAVDEVVPRDHEPGHGPLTVRPLADAAGVRALPSRANRATSS